MALLCFYKETIFIKKQFILLHLNLVFHLTLQLRVPYVVLPGVLIQALIRLIFQQGSSITWAQTIPGSEIGRAKRMLIAVS